MTFKLNSRLFGSLVRAELYDSGIKVEDQYLSSKSQTDREEILKYGVKFDPFSEIQQNSASDWCAYLKERVVGLFRDTNDFYKIQLISDNIFPTLVDDNDYSQIEDITLTGDIIQRNLGKTVNATIRRSFFKNGEYNSVCFPFDLSERQIIEGPFNGVKILYISNVEYDSESQRLTFVFAYAKSMKAGYPYLIFWDEGGGNIINPTFFGVKISVASPINKNINNLITPTGTFSSTTITSRDLYVSNNQVYYPTESIVIDPFSFYFKLNTITVEFISGIDNVFDDFSFAPNVVGDNSNIDFFQSVTYDNNEYTIIDLPEGVDKVCLFDKNAEYPQGDITVQFNNIEKQCEKILIITLSPNSLNEVVNISSQIYKSQSDPHRNKNDHFVKNTLLTDDFYRVNNKQTLEDREKQVGIGQGDPESFSYQIGNLAIDPISHVILGTQKKFQAPYLFRKFCDRRKINNLSQWDKNTEYSLGDKVFCCEQIWISMTDGNLGLHPQLSPFWKIFLNNPQDVTLFRRTLPEIANEEESSEETEETQSEEKQMPSYFRVRCVSGSTQTDIDEAEVYGGEGRFRYTSASGRRTIKAHEGINISQFGSNGGWEVVISGLISGKYYTIEII